MKRAEILAIEDQLRKTLNAWKNYKTETIVIHAKECAKNMMPAADALHEYAMSQEED